MSIKPGDLQDYIEYIEQLPLNPSPEAFGLHDNAEITNANNETLIMLETLLSVQPRSSSGGGSTRDDKIEEIANFVQSRTPEVFMIEDISKKVYKIYNFEKSTRLVTRKV